MGFLVVNVGQGLFNEVLIALMGGDIMALTCRDRLVTAFYLSVILWVEGSLCHVFCTEKGTKKAEEFADKL